MFQLCDRRDSGKSQTANFENTDCSAHIIRPLYKAAGGRPVLTSIKHGVPCDRQLSFRLEDVLW
jgi:hypothetical protein